MDVRQLEVFLAMMEHSSVTRTAEKLYVSPGAVSLQLHNLAAELGTELFARSGRRIVPTTQAFRLATHAREVIQRMKAIQHDFANVAAEDARPFHLATGATTLIHRLGPPLRLLRQRFPKANIHVTVAPTEPIVAGVLEGRYDLGLISLPWQQRQEELSIMPLFEEELLVLRPSHRPVLGSSVQSVRPSELASVPFLLYPKTSNMRLKIDRFFGEAEDKSAGGDGSRRHGGDQRAGRGRFWIFHTSAIRLARERPALSETACRGTSAGPRTSPGNAESGISAHPDDGDRRILTFGSPPFQRRCAASLTRKSARNSIGTVAQSRRGCARA